MTSRTIFMTAIDGTFRRAAAAGWFCLAVLLLAACEPAPPPPETRPPQPAAPSTGATAQRAATPAAPASRHMIAAANPLAAEAGLNILRAGGSAIDAAIAAQMMLTLVESQSSGIGGGAFLMHYNAQSGAIDSYDGRETAPAAAAPDMFLQADGAAKSFFDAVVGGSSVGVPGLVCMLEMVHAERGRLPWKDLFQPAIRRAEAGFIVSPRLAGLLEKETYLKDMPAARAYFYEADGRPKSAGTRLRNPALAETLAVIADKGADGFYLRPVARGIVDTVRSAEKNPSGMTLADMAAYAARKRPPVCLPYRVWLICGMGPPSSGGLTTLQILGILQSFRPGGRDPLRRPRRTPDRRGEPAGVCRPQHLHRRSGLRAGAGGRLARPGLPATQGSGDRS